MQVAAVCAGWLVLEVYLLGLSMHLTGPRAWTAFGAGALCAVMPLVTVIAWRLYRERNG
jgi:hypothetical protein